MALTKTLLRVMQLTAVLLTVFCLSVAARSSSQSITYTGKNVPLETVFQAIQDQTGYFILFEKTFAKNTSPVTINATDMPLKEFLDHLFRDQPLTYTQKKTTITITRKLPKSPTIGDALSTVPPFTGKVVGPDGQPIAGANITVNGTKKGTTTGVDGTFSIEAKEGDELTISFIGYEKKIVKVSNGKIIVGLNPSKSPLDEIQIIAYGKTSQRLNTGTVYTVKGDEIAKQPVTNPLMALMGRVPNLVISPNSGQPNGAVNLQLRGQNSLSTRSLRSEPLIVVDGIPIQNTTQVGIGGSAGITNDQISALTFINKNDIEQIDVLSDADATSIYGSRGGNGVILVTTKRGKSGATTGNISLSTGISRAPKKIKLLNTEQYLAMRRQGYLNDGLPVPDQNSPVKTPNNYDLTVWDPNRYTDWQEMFLGGTATNYNINASVQGGNQSLQYLISGDYIKQGYVFPEDAKFQTGNINLNLSGSSPNQRFNFQLGNNYTFNNTFTPYSDFTRLAVILAPNAPALYDQYGFINWESIPGMEEQPGTWKNPYATLLQTNTSRNNSLRQTGQLSYRLLPKLTLKVSGGYTETSINMISIAPIAAEDPAYIGATGQSVRSIAKNKSFTLDPQLNYRTTLATGNIDVLLGASYQQQSQGLETVSGFGFVSDALLKSMANAGFTTAENQSSEYKYLAGFGRINYNVNNKYIATLAGRRDGSSRFGPGYQFGNFWSIGGAWIPSEEDFFQQLHLPVSYAKLRASFGTSGNDGIGDYQYLELYQTLPGEFIYQDYRVIRSQGAVNPDYHWESIKKLDIGIDVGIFQERLLLNATYWQTRAGDQIGNYTVPSTAGNLFIVKNQGAKIQNAGWEFFLNARLLTNKNFKWSSQLNLGFTSNKLLSSPDELLNAYSLSPFVRVGEPFTGFSTGRKYRGLNIINGLYQFEDYAGNATTNPDNANTQGVKIDTRPFTMGINNDLVWKNFTLTFFVQLTRQLGKNFLYDPLFASRSAGSFATDEFANLPVEYLNYWKQPGQIAEFQAVSSRPFAQPQRLMREYVSTSDKAWVDASFIRLRNVQLSYALPASLLKRLKLRNMAFYVQGQNLITITSYGGLDPETQKVGSLPLLKTLMGGISISLN